MLRRLLALFFLSGASGLIYQVVWLRVLGNVFGNTTSSAALVVAIFMLGLGMGSYLVGRWADRPGLSARHFLRAYGLFELGIAALALVVSLLLPHLDPFSAAFSSYVPDARGWFRLSLGSLAARAFIASLVLLPITLLMGGTLTLLIRFTLGRDQRTSGFTIGLLYGINTFGAALGSFLTDAALVPAVGLGSTQHLAILLNLIAAAGALRLGAKLTEPTPTTVDPSPAEVPHRRERLTALAIGLSGFAAMAMEMVWFRHLSCLLGSERSVFSLVLSFVLIGIWLGSMLGGYAHLRLGRPVALFAVTQAAFILLALLGVALASADPAANVAPASWATSPPPDWLGRLYDVGARAPLLFLEVLLPSVMMGCSYPLANAIIQHGAARVGRRAGGLYLANTCGAVLGSLVAGFVMLPQLGMQGTIFAVALVVVLGLVPLAALILSPDPEPRARWPVGAALVATLLALGAWQLLPVDTILLRSVGPLLPGERLTSLSEGLTEIMGIAEGPRGKQLLTNGHPMSGTQVMNQRYMRAFAHLPLLQLEKPERAAVICFGVGNTLHAVSLHPSIQRIELIDLSAQILSHAGSFRETNGDVLSDPRVSVFVNDGRHHLRLQPEGSYDLITLEPPPIRFAGVAALYSREFYQLARSRLKADGYLTQWLPVYQVPGAEALAIIRSFIDVFPQAVLLSGAGGELILMGTRGRSIEIDPVAVERHRQERPAVARDLEGILMGTPVELIGTFVASAPLLRALTQGSVPVTDDEPSLEYTVNPALVSRHTPAALFDVTRVLEWCPACRRADGAPVAGLEALPDYLRVLSRLYSAPEFLGAGSLDVTVPVVTTSADAALIELRPYLRGILTAVP